MVKDGAADERTDKPIDPDTVTGPDGTDVDNHTVKKATDAPADASMKDSAEPPDGDSDGFETVASIRATETRDDAAQAKTDIAAVSPIDNMNEATDAVTGAMDEDETMETPRTTDTAEN